LGYSFCRGESYALVLTKKGCARFLGDFLPQAHLVTLSATEKKKATEKSLSVQSLLKMSTKRRRGASASLILRANEFFIIIFWDKNIGVTVKSRIPNYRILKFRTTCCQTIK
jgi:hypothetical protein